MLKKSQGGFTLIELVMVIVILGILAAIALPKFVDLGKDARIGAMKGVEGAMRSANTMIYAKAAAANQLGTGQKVKINGVDVNTEYGFAKSVADLISVMDLSTDFNTATLDEVRHTGASDASKCVVKYTKATETVAPAYTTDFDKC